MRYLATGDFQGRPLTRLTLLWTLLFVGGLWATSACMYFSRMSLAPESVRAYYLGSEEEFRNPRTMQSMLETTHAHLPAMGVVLLLLTHLLVFAPGGERAKRLVIAATFLSALSGEASGWLVRFVHPGFAWLKIASFLAFQACLGGLVAGLAVFLLRGRGRKGRA